MMLYELTAGLGSGAFILMMVALIINDRPPGPGRHRHSDDHLDG